MRAIVRVGLAVVCLGLLAVPRAANAQYAEDSAGLGTALGPVDFSVHGYFRAPLRFGWRNRGAGLRDGELVYNVHTPWLVDDDYFRSGFAYTRVQEKDWTELFVNVGTKHVSGTIGFQNSLFSEWARPLLDNQLGIAQGFLTFRWDWSGKDWKLKLQLKGGSFWDRFGWLESYDTYVFGRTHQLGAQGRLQLDYGRLSASVLYGFGAHLEAIDINEGLTLLNYVVANASWNGMVGAGVYYLGSSTQDKRQLKEIQDADMSVTGFDAWLQHPATGRLYAAFSFVDANNATYLGPAVEVLHSYGGRGITENFLGSERSQNGTGSLTNFAFEWGYSLRDLLERYSPSSAGGLHGGDVRLRLFGLYSHVNSKQVDPDPSINKDNRGYFKWGVEPEYRPLSWLVAAVRYDRVVLNLDDDANSFRAITPRLSFTTHFLANAMISFQYTHYWYGARVLLRPGQVALETQPDADVFKMQAQFVF